MTARIVPGVASDRPDSLCFEIAFSSDCWDWGRWGARRCFRFHAGPDRPYLWMAPDPDYRLAQVWPDDGLPGRRRTNCRWTMPPLSYPVDRVLWMGVLAHHEGVIVHACGWSLNGRSVLCPGVSGAGKSTLARQIVAMGQGTVLSDDRVVVRGAPDGFMAWGTPWPGEGRQADPSGAPLTGIAFIEQATENALIPLSPADALRRLFATASVPWYDADLRDRVLPLLERLVNTVPAWRFRCRPEPDAAVLLQERLG